MLEEKLVEVMPAQSKGGIGKSMLGRCAARGCEARLADGSGSGVVSSLQDAEPAKRRLGFGRQEFPAELVAGVRGLFGQQHRVAPTGQLKSGAAPGEAASDDERVVGHVGERRGKRGKEGRVE
jgi:hypothetical protein